MSVLIVISIDAPSPEALAPYQSLARPSLRDFGIRLLARSGDATVLEGKPTGKRVVVLEAESEEAARRWYTSPQYQAAIDARKELPPFTIQLVERP